MSSYDHLTRTTFIEPETTRESVTRLSRDLALSAGKMDRSSARFLVDAYYNMQHNRITAESQVRDMAKANKSHEVLEWLYEQNRVLEQQIQRALDKWTDAHYMGRWAKSIVGIGPVISAGLLANIELHGTRTLKMDDGTEFEEEYIRNTAGHIWHFAGIAHNGDKWEKGKKRPWNADLKTLIVFKAGESFVKVQNHPKDFYGKVYFKRKKMEQEKNDLFHFKDQAEEILRTKKIGKTTDAYMYYSEGKLPPAHIHARARRFAAKLFISHYHHMAFQHEFGVPPPMPYPIAHLGHADWIAPPNMNFEQEEKGK